VTGGHGDLLRRKIQLSAPLFHRVTTRFWEHPDLASLYPRFLLAIHGSVRATVPLMVAAVEELKRRPDTALNRRLIAYFEEHATEESEHEEWLLQDLAVLGVNREAALGEYGIPAIAALAGAQYYWIRHAHPVALLGCFAVLEGHPPTLAHLEDAERRTGLPADAFRMLRQHAVLDVQHGVELFDLIDQLPLDSRLAGLLAVSAIQTMASLGDMFTTLVSARTLVSLEPGLHHGRSP